MGSDWYQLSTTAVLKQLRSSATGLSSAEAAKRRFKYGENSLPAARAIPLWLIFARQFISPLIYVLVAAAIVILLINGPADAIFIGVVLLINAIIGAAQEGRTQNTLRALKQFVETKATVMREGAKSIVNDTALVPGDILWLQEGEKVPADARVLQSHNLLVNEAALTGESTPVHKIGAELSRAAALADQKNMLWRGSLVLGGNGTAVVTATGLETEIGRITKSLANVEGEMPLKQDIADLSRLIIEIVAVVCVVLLFIGLAKGYSLAVMVTTAVSLAVSIVPEGLPVVLTLILSTGVWRMSRRHALVKKLQAVEGLGQVDVIAVDKTGTITQNRMTLTDLYLKNGERDRKLAATIAANCATARVDWQAASKEWLITGDPTEAALLLFAKEAGVEREALLAKQPIIEELPFDYHTKLHAVLTAQPKGELLSVCGAPEVITAACHLSAEEKQTIHQHIAALTGKGLRVVAFASKKGQLHRIRPHLESLTFGGLFGLQDPLHEEVPATVTAVTAAGIKVVLITGDHEITARAIAQAANIFTPGDLILSGADLELLTRQELQAKLPTTSVFYRVTPEQKMVIVEGYQAIGQKICMTGDGVNDAPSLVAADLGVAMGRSGTEVAKEAADIVLLDDNFTSIVAAIEEGRNIYATIQKAIAYIFTTNVAEVLAIVGSILLGLPLLLPASQIIWLNFVTDGFLTAALGAETPEANGLQEPRSAHRLINWRMLQQMLTVGILMAVSTLILFNYFQSAGIEKASTIALTTLAAVQWVFAWNVRRSQSIFSGQKQAGSPYLLVATLGVIALQITAVYVPALQHLLHTTNLTWHEWLLCLVPAVVIFFIEEIRKPAASHAPRAS